MDCVVLFYKRVRFIGKMLLAVAVERSEKKTKAKNCAVVQADTRASTYCTSTTYNSMYRPVRGYVDNGTQPFHTCVKRCKIAQYKNIENIRVKG